MNITSDVKDELLDVELGEGVSRAWLSGILKGIGVLSISKKNISLQFVSENFMLINQIVAVVKSLYKCEATIDVDKLARPKVKTFVLSIPQGVSKYILLDLKAMGETDGELSCFNDGIDSDIYENQDNVRAFVRGLFQAVGSAFAPSKFLESDGDKSDGYQLEFVLTSEQLAIDLVSMLFMFGIPAKRVERKGSYVVYLKDSESISNMFALIGANNAVLTVQEIIVERLVSNDINRQNNCAYANIDKAVNAGMKQVRAINYIDKKMGLDKLPDNLRELAKLRLDMPSASLGELAEVLGGLTKSGLNHRFRKIMDIANELKSKDELYQNAEQRDAEQNDTIG